MPSELYNSKVKDDTAGNVVSEQENNDQHLRSTENVTGYKIHATDGEIGKVVDYMIDDATWKIKYLVVETGPWLNSRKVLLSTQWISEVNWDNSAVIVDVSLAKVQNSPEFNIDQVLNESYERNLYDYYAKPGRS